MKDLQVLTFIGRSAPVPVEITREGEGFRATLNHYGAVTTFDSPIAHVAAAGLIPNIQHVFAMIGDEIVDGTITVSGTMIQRDETAIFRAMLGVELRFV